MDELCLLRIVLDSLPLHPELLVFDFIDDFKDRALVFLAFYLLEYPFNDQFHDRWSLLFLGRLRLDVVAVVTNDVFNTSFRAILSKELFLHVLHVADLLGLWGDKLVWLLDDVQLD